MRPRPFEDMRTIMPPVSRSGTILKHTLKQSFHVVLVTNVTYIWTTNFHSHPIKVWGWVMAQVILVPQSQLDYWILDFFGIWSRETGLYWQISFKLCELEKNYLEENLPKMVHLAHKSYGWCGLVFRFGTALGLGLVLRGPDLGLGLDNSGNNLNGIRTSSVEISLIPGKTFS